MILLHRLIDSMVMFVPLRRFRKKQVIALQCNKHPQSLPINTTNTADYQGTNIKHHPRLIPDHTGRNGIVDRSMRMFSRRE